MKLNVQVFSLLIKYNSFILTESYWNFRIYLKNTYKLTKYLRLILKVFFQYFTKIHLDSNVLLLIPNLHFTQSPIYVTIIQMFTDKKFKKKKKKKKPTGEARILQNIFLCLKANTFQTSIRYSCEIISCF